jgi:hypothetical protein
MTQLTQFEGLRRNVNRGMTQTASRRVPSPAARPKTRQAFLLSCATPLICAPEQSGCYQVPNRAVETIPNQTAPAGTVQVVAPALFAVTVAPVSQATWRKR